MGAWGIGTFDNDTACDWSDGLERVQDLSLVKEALAKVAETSEDYLDSDVATQALAACEVIARLKGNWEPRNSYTETVDRWVETHPLAVPNSLVTVAVSVIDRVLTPPSELLELWQE